jgi:hypothetical protein
MATSANEEGLAGKFSSCAESQVVNTVDIWLNKFSKKIASFSFYFDLYVILTTLFIISTGKFCQPRESFYYTCMVTSLSKLLWSSLNLHIERIFTRILSCLRFSCRAAFELL